MFCRATCGSSGCSRSPRGAGGWAVASSGTLSSSTATSPNARVMSFPLISEQQHEADREFVVIVGAAVEAGVVPAPVRPQPEARFQLLADAGTGAEREGVLLRALHQGLARNVLEAADAEQQMHWDALFRPGLGDGFQDRK